MAKMTNVRERVHQPFWDTFIRTSGVDENVRVTEREQLFTNRQRGNDITAVTNLLNGSTLPSDQSHVTLALRVFTWYKAPVVKAAPGAGVPIGGGNGDFTPANAVAFFNAGGAGNAPGDYHDVYRLHWQTLEQLHWSFGAGEKYSINNLHTKYFPDGGGLSGDNGGVSDLIHWQNGEPTHTAILRLARAILLPPRQNVYCTATIHPLPAGSNGAFVRNAVGRNFLSLADNLNALDGISKVITFTFDGLFARDVQ